MRTVKLSLIIASLTLAYFGCGGSKTTPDAFAAIEKNKMVRIATNAVNVPFEFGLGTGVQGFDVDLGDAIAKDIGYPAKWVKIDEFNRMFEILKNGEVEMIISTVAITPEREKDFAFSIPYFDSGNTIARRKDNQEIKDLASLAGKRVGVQTGRTGDLFMESQKIAANVAIVKFQTLDDALGALNRGEISAVVGDEPIITYSIYKSYSTNLITTGVEVTKNQYGVAVRKDETELLKKINATIQSLKSAGELEKWREKWFQNVMEETKGMIQDIEKTELLKASPKTLSVTFIKESGSTVRMDRLDGFNATLTGPGGSFTSNSITTDDAGVRGSCRFTTPVPPGDYTFAVSRISVSEKIKIDKLPVTSMNIILTFTTRGVGIVIK